MGGGGVLDLIILLYKSTHKKLILKFVQGFNKYSDDDFKLPFDILNRGEITDSGKTKINICHACSLNFFNIVKF